MRSEEGKVIYAVSVEKKMDIRLDTGIAVANVGDKQTHVSLFLVNEMGERPEEIRNVPAFTLEPGHHGAFFLSELCKQPPSGFVFCTFDFLAEQDFRGGLLITSPEPIAVTTLRTIGGIAVSSLPVGSTQR